MEALIALGAVAAAVLAITGVVRLVLPFFRRISEFLDDWSGEPERPGHPPRPGVPERLQNIEGEQKRVAKELEHNGGSSLKDAVKRIEDEQITQKAQAAADRAVLQSILSAFGQFVGREQDARIKGHEAEGELWRAVQELNGNGHEEIVEGD